MKVENRILTDIASLEQLPPSTLARLINSLLVMAGDMGLVVRSVIEARQQKIGVSEAECELTDELVKAFDLHMRSCEDVLVDQIRCGEGGEAGSDGVLLN